MQQAHIHVVLSIAPLGIVVYGIPEGQIVSSSILTLRAAGQTLLGRHLWSRGYCVSTVGLDEEQIRKYVKYQECKDRDSEQGDLGLD